VSDDSGKVIVAHPVEIVAITEDMRFNLQIVKVRELFRRRFGIVATFTEAYVKAGFGIRKPGVRRVGPGGLRRNGSHLSDSGLCYVDRYKFKVGRFSVRFFRAGKANLLDRTSVL
jgi:hypothetical protein